MAKPTVEVTFSKACVFAGEEKKKGDKLKVTKAQAELLKVRELIS